MSSAVDNSHFSKLETYYDGHIGVMIYEYMMENNYIDKKLGMQKMIHFARKTKMITYLINLIHQLNESNETEADLTFSLNEVALVLSKRREKFRCISTTLKSDRFIGIVESGSRSHDEILKTSYNSLSLPKNFPRIIYDYMTIMYDTGNYAKSLKYICLYSRLLDKTSDAYLECLWGKLSCNILKNNLIVASDCIDEIANELELRVMDHRDKIVQFSYLLHLSLLVYFKSTNLINRFFEVCFNNGYFRQALEMISPYLTRYVIISALVYNDIDSELKEFRSLLLHSTSDYSDCFVKLIKSLFIDYDVELSIEQLNLCLIEFQQDYFVRELVDVFEAKIYLHILKLYYQIHPSVSLSSVVSCFGIDTESAQVLINQLFSVEDPNLVIETVFPEDSSWKNSMPFSNRLLEDFTNKLKVVE